MDLKIKTGKEEFHGRTCGIIKQENKFLIMRVNKTSYYHIPGGHIEIGEDSKQAVIREIKEELQAAINVGERLITVNYNGYEKFDLTMHCYLCTLTEDSHVTLLEHEAAKWLTKETLYSVDWLPADIEAVDALYKHL